MQSLKKRLDYSEYGGVPLLGVGGICIKCHGFSKAPTIRSAIVRQAYRAIKININEHIRQQLHTLMQAGK